MSSSPERKAESERETRSLHGQTATDSFTPNLDWALLHRLGLWNRLAAREQNGELPAVDSTGDSSPVPSPAGTDGWSCSQCESTESVETTVREHADCGYISVDILTRARSDGPAVCPKCVADNRDGSAFGVIGTVHRCVGCGQLIDRPLRGRPGGQ